MKSILFIDEINKDRISEVGGKGANLGEMTQAGFPVPGGFCLTTEVYDFVARGLMDDREDLFHLHLCEIDHAIDHDADLREKINERKREYERLFRLPSPRIITSEGEVLQGGVKVEGMPENALAGAGVSAGRVEGIARVVQNPRGAVLEKGEILVAAFTDPGWTPLFVNASGLVTEVGGMLTHGAVVAREYGIPGVVGVTDATTRIHTGQRIIVDGSNGFVILK